jgi:putative transposase
MRARPVVLTTRQRAILERVSRARAAEQRLVERATIVVFAANGLSDVEIASCLEVDPQRPRRWRKRWLAASPALTQAEEEGATDRDLEDCVLRVFEDNARPGGPLTFGPERVAQLISLGCEPPADSGLPINRWTPEELAREAVKRGIVESISPRHLDRIMKRG